MLWLIQKKVSIVEHFKDIKDFRIRFSHPLTEVIVIAICACICNADTWVDVEIWGKANIEWLKKFLSLPFGIPSHDTFGRIFSIIKSEEFEKCFICWANSISEVVGEIIDIIPVDGKSVKHSYDKRSNKAAIHIVGAWSSKNKISLGQVKTSEKSNEITAIPELLNALSVSGCVVTLDAMGCQKAITKKIIEEDADYVIATKDNQPTLHQEIAEHFEAKFEYDHKKLDFHETIEAKDGCKISRRYYVCDDIEELDSCDEFEGLSSIGMVETKREKEGKTSYETRYYILSFIASAVFFSDCARGHWGIENSLHWVLDVCFNEDASRIRKDNGAENMAIIRRVALNLLKKETSKKNRSMKSKRLLAGWDKSYLEKVVGL